MAKVKVTKVDDVVIMVSQHVEIDQKPCDHKIEHWVHERYESGLGDAYYCGDCNELMQVG